MQTWKYYRVRPLFFVVIGAFALCALITKSHVTSWNDAARFATIDSLANRGTFAIEGSSFARVTSDTYRYRGHVYGGAPGIALLGAGVALALKGAGITIGSRHSLWIYLITLLVIGGWFALGCGYAFAFGRALGYSVRFSAFSAILSGVATLNLPYAAVYSYHVPCGAAMLAGLYHLFRVRDGIVHAVASGLFLSLAFVFDQGAVVVGLMAVVMLYRAPLSRILIFLGASVPLIGLELAYTWHFSGAFIPPSLNHHFYGLTAKGLSSDIRPAHEYLSNIVNVTIGNNGLFLYTSLTFVCVFGLAKLWQSAKPENRRLTLAILATSVPFFGLVALFTMDSLAANYGERRFVDIFFILCIGLAPAIAALRGRPASYAALAAVVLSLVMAALGTVNPFAGQGGVPGYAVAAVEFGQLARRSPLQAGLDIAALVALIALVVRFWPRLARTPQP